MAHTEYTQTPQFSACGTQAPVCWHPCPPPNQMLPLLWEVPSLPNLSEERSQRWPHLHKVPSSTAILAALSRAHKRGRQHSREDPGPGVRDLGPRPGSPTAPSTTLNLNIFIYKMGIKLDKTVTAFLLGLS